MDFEKFMKIAMIVPQHFAINTSTNKLPKLLSPILKPVTTNKYATKN